MQFSSMEVPARVLSLTPGSNGWWNGRCPHPDHEDVHPSFSARRDVETGELLTYCHVCDDQAAVRQAAEKQLEDAGLSDFIESGEVHPVMASPTPEAKKVFLREKALDIWENADFKTDVVEKYLQGRGVVGPVPASIRQSTLPYTLGSGVLYPCMVAEVTDVNYETVGIHRTYLEEKPDCTITKAKVPAPKKSLGSIKGNHIRLSDEYLGTLHLTEGVETGLAVREALSASVWACISAQNLAAVLVPDDAETIFIWADKDRSGTGEKFAKLAAERLTQQGKKVFILAPDAEIPEGKKSVDWLDLGHDAIVSAFAKLNAPETPTSLPTPPPATPWGHLKMPPGYEITANGVYLEKPRANGELQTVMVATGPVWISGKRTDLATGETEVQVSWMEMTGKVSSRWLHRGQAFRSSAILDMVDIAGFPVYDGINRDTVKFLALLERCNNIPTELIARRPGWNIAPSGEQVFITSRDQRDVIFHPEQAYRTYADALHKQGSLDIWLKELLPIFQKFPLVLFAVVSSLAAPLLRIFGAPNFAIDFWGRTSCGKTTLLKIIASVWGSPSGLIMSWNNTVVFAERVAGFFGNGFVIYFDDSQTASDKIIEFITYLVVNATSKGRGKPSGLQEITKFQVVMFATGEKPITERAYPGSKARVIEIHGSPFPGIDPSQLQAIKTMIMGNYGHLGEMFIETLMSLPEETLRAAYAEHIKFYTGCATNEIGYRFAEYFATIQVAGEILAHVPQMGWNEQLFNDTMDFVWKLSTVEMMETDMAQKALIGLAAWIESNKRHFAIAGTITELQPTYGKILRDEGYVAIPPFIFQRALAELGIQSSAAVIAEWKRQGYLIHSPSRNHHQVKIEGRPVWCFCIKLDALFAQEGDGVLTQAAPTDANQLAQNQLPN